MPLDVTPTRVERVFEEQVEASVEVAELDTLDPETRDRRAIRINNTDICTRMCDFKDLCEAELEGKNTAILLRTVYETKKKRPKIEVSQEVGV